ncbi:MAG: hypothetical protein B7C24_14150 [Bacteroidetes bacterium 4572_77]|nr:MAG: hypothetical protein B7C24_14150 [Bacteroidetes bacterium 4572_77]
MRRRPSALKRFWFRLGGSNPYAPKKKVLKSSKGFSIAQLWNNYQAYRKDKRKYIARKRFFKQKEKERREKEVRNNSTNPLYQLFFSHERLKKVQLNKEGVVIYTPSLWNSFIHIVNATASFLVAYLMVYLLYQLVVLITASFYDIDSILYYYKLSFNNHSKLWDSLNIIIITLSGPVNSLFLGFFFYNYLFYKAKSYPNLRLFYLWAGLLFFAHFFAAFIAGIATNKGFGYVPMWLFWNEFVKFFFAFIALLALVLLGYNSASRFLSTSNNVYRIQKNNRALFFLHQVVLPYILGLGIILLVKIPHNPAYDTLILVFVVFIIGASFYHFQSKPSPNFSISNKASYLNVILLLLALVSIYAFRVYLENGLHFIIRLSMSIRPAGGGF